MGWTIVLENESGKQIEVLEGEMSSKNYNEFKSYRLLKYLDPVGDLTLNSMQLNDLRKDIEDYMKANRKFEELGKRIMQLIEKSKGSTHTYIKFYGD